MFRFGISAIRNPTYFFFRNGFRFDFKLASAWAIDLPSCEDRRPPMHHPDFGYPKRLGVHGYRRRILCGGASRFLIIHVLKLATFLNGFLIHIFDFTRDGIKVWTVVGVSDKRGD